MTINELLALNNLTANDQIPVWDAEATGSTEPTAKITAQNFANAVKSLASLIGTADLDATPTQGSTKAIQSGGVFDAIAQSTATASTTATLASGWSVASEQNIIYKSGNIVSLSLWVNGETITQNAWNQIATIQSDYRPLKTIDFLGINNGNDKAVHCQITRAGSVSVYGSADAGSNLRLFVTYFCG